MKRELNVIVIVMDSLRQDHISYYNENKRVFHGVPVTKTPNLDKLALDGITFKNAYPSGLPTIPQRTELMTGQFTLPYKAWSPLNTSDLTLAAFLKRRGYITSLVSDTYHMFKPGYNFYSYLDYWEFIRGQEFDQHGLPPPKNRNANDYSNENIRKDSSWMALINKFLSNIDEFRDEREEDWFPCKVFSRGASLLSGKGDKKLFLWIDSFDPHEPWEHPHNYDAPYRDPDAKPRIILPKGGEARLWASEEEVNDIRALYAGEVSFVDSCFGHFYAALKEGGFMDNSVVVVLADHGHPLADHGKFLKGGDRLYNELIRIPFMITVPQDVRSELGIKRKTFTELIAVPDIFPTLLDVLGLPEDAIPLAGKSFLPILRGEAGGRPYVITGYHEAPDRCVRDSGYSYISRPAGQPDELYDLNEDPKETHNLIDERPDEARRLAKSLKGIWSLSSPNYVKGIQGKYELCRRSDNRYSHKIL